MPGHILCSVEDNGIGREFAWKERNKLTEQKSYGMGIVRKRLELLAETEDGNFSLDITDLRNESGNPEGTKVILQLPFKIVTHD